MTKKRKSARASQQCASNGFDTLISSYTVALEDNSESIADMLQLLSGRELTKSDLKALRGIKRDLDRINKDLDSLGD